MIYRKKRKIDFLKKKTKLFFLYQEFRISINEFKIKFFPEKIILKIIIKNENKNFLLIKYLNNFMDKKCKFNLRNNVRNRFK